jgi:hypothetical protein
MRIKRRAFLVGALRQNAITSLALQVPLPGCANELTLFSRIIDG